MSEAAGGGQVSGGAGPGQVTRAGRDTGVQAPRLSCVGAAGIKGRCKHPRGGLLLCGDPRVGLEEKASKTRGGGMSFGKFFTKKCNCKLVDAGDLLHLANVIFV